MGEPVIGTEIAEEGVSIVALHEHDLGLGIQLRVGLGGRIVRDTRLQGHLGTQVPGVRVGLGTPRPDVLKSMPSVAGLGRCQGMGSHGCYGVIGDGRGVRAASPTRAATPAMSARFTVFLSTVKAPLMINRFSSAWRALG